MRKWSRSLRRLAIIALWAMVPLIVDAALFISHDPARLSRVFLKAPVGVDGSAVVTRAYDIQELLHGYPNYIEPPNELFPTKQSNQAGLNWPLIEARENETERLIALLENTVDPTSWIDTGEPGAYATLRELSGQLFVTQSVANQVRIDAILWRMCLRHRLIRHMPYSYPTWLALTVAGWLTIRRFGRKALRRRMGLCVQCGYDLRASAERCPECGKLREYDPELSTARCARDTEIAKKGG